MYDRNFAFHEIRNIVANETTKQSLLPRDYIEADIVNSKNHDETGGGCYEKNPPRDKLLRRI